MGVKKVVIMFIFRFSCRCIGFGYVFCCLISFLLPPPSSVRLMMYYCYYTTVQYNIDSSPPYSMVDDDSPYTSSHSRVLVIYHMLYHSNICCRVSWFLVPRLLTS